MIYTKTMIDNAEIIIGPIGKPVYVIPIEVPEDWPGPPFTMIEVSLVNRYREQLERDGQFSIG